MAETTQESAMAPVVRQSSVDPTDEEVLEKVLNAPCNQQYENLQALTKTQKLDSKITSQIFQTNSDIHRYIEVSTSRY